MGRLVNLLFKESPLVINKTLAKTIGLNEAIVLLQLNYWIKNNEDNKKNFKDGCYWTFNSIKNWHEQEFSFWSYATVKRVFSDLEKMKLIIAGNYNDEKRDKTKWYTIDYDKLEKLLEENINENDKVISNGNNDTTNDGGMHQCIGSICTNALHQNDPMHCIKMTQPLPENIYIFNNAQAEEVSVDENALEKEACDHTQGSINSKKSYAEFVTMTDKEYKKLITKYGEKDTARLIEMLDNYKGARGISYKSDYRAILNWVVAAFEKEKAEKTRLSGYQAKSKARVENQTTPNAGAYKILSLED